MKRYLALLIFICIISCKKETSIEGLPTAVATPTPNNNSQSQLITAEFLDGQKIKDFIYDNAGKLISVKNYFHPKIDEYSWVMERIFNNKGLPIRDNYRLPNATIINEYRTYTYNTVGECIADSSYYWIGADQYYSWRNWNITNNEYDNKGRVKKTFVNHHGGEKYIFEYTYDNDGNIATETNSFSKNTWPTFTNQYKFSTDKVFQHPLSNNIDNNIYIYNRWCHKMDKNFCTKFSNSSITVDFTIIEKNAQGKPTKIRWDFSGPNGGNQTNIYTYTYK